MTITSSEIIKIIIYEWKFYPKCWCWLYNALHAKYGNIILLKVEPDLPSYEIPCNLIRKFLFPVSKQINTSWADVTQRNSKRFLLKEISAWIFLIILKWCPISLKTVHDIAPKLITSAFCVRSKSLPVIICFVKATTLITNHREDPFQK